MFFLFQCTFITFSPAFLCVVCQHALLHFFQSIPMDLLLTVTKKWLDWVQQSALPIITTKVLETSAIAWWTYHRHPVGTLLSQPLVEIVASVVGDVCTASSTLSYLWCSGQPSVRVLCITRYPALVIQCNCRPLFRRRLIFLNRWKRQFDRRIRCLTSQDVSLTVCLSTG